MKRMSTASVRQNSPKTANRKRSAEINGYKRKALEHYELAQLKSIGFSESQHHLDQARSFVTHALEMVDTDGDLLNLLARIDLDLGNKMKAEAAIKNALVIHPRNGGYWFSSGHINLATGNISEAEKAFKKAIRYSAKETRAESSLAYTYAIQGRHVEAFQLYRELAKTASHDPHIRNKLIECISHIKADDYDSELELDLLHYYSWDNIDKNKLASLSCSLVERKFILSTESCQAGFDDLANDPLLLAALHQSLIKSPTLERLIMTLRYELLLDSTKNSQIRSDYLPLASALCSYGFNSDFILPETESESNMIKAIKTLIQSAIQVENCEPNDISGAILLLGMYEPLSKDSDIRQFINADTQRWNQHCRSIIQRYRQDIQLSSLSIERISRINQTEIQSQYELYPYPKWETLEYRRPTDYGQALAAELQSKLPISLSYKNKLSILIAGCGTGRHALHVAKYFKNVDVTAIDFSRASLAFAKYKAKELGIENITFYQADLLNINRPDWEFDVIECSGVLHHIKQPHKALNNLLKMLKPGGLLKLALYSQYAREPVQKIRDLWNTKAMALDDRKMKIIRQAVLASDVEGKDRLINSDDFYSLSGCKDLLFNEFEKTYTPLSIERLCQKHQLSMLGFVHLSHQTKLDFCQRFECTEKALNHLKLWEQFESEHPDLFSGMYQFYCQHNPKLSVLS